MIDDEGHTSACLPWNEAPVGLVISRRQFFLDASAAALCAPAVVRCASLMPVRGIAIPPGALHFGFVDRMYVHLHLPKITPMQNEGLSLHQIAGELNRRGPRPMIDRPWDAQFVISVLRRNEQIKRADAYLRATRALLLEAKCQNEGKAE